MEQREQSQALLELCRVATEEGYFQIKEIKESAFGTGCAQQAKQKFLLFLLFLRDKKVVYGEPIID